MLGPRIKDMQLSSIAVLLSLLDECRTEEELRSVCARISPLLREHEDREHLVAAFRRHLDTILKGRSNGTGKGEGAGKKDAGKCNKT